MHSQQPRLFVTLIGNIAREPFAQVKYGYLLAALKRKYSLVVCDATLRGFPRIINALQVFSPDRQLWKARFYQNVPAFKARSRIVAEALRKQASNIDLVFQIGVLYDACWKNPGIPNILYTDYTSHLALHKPGLGRGPQQGRERMEWISLEKRAFQRAAHICTRSDFVRDSVIRDYQIPAEKVTAIGGGVNIDPLPTVPSRREPHLPTALFIGKDYFRKGGDILLPAFQKTRKMIPNARLMMVTDGPIPGGVALDGVEIIPPTWDRSAIYSLYGQADCFVLPSRLETWGDVFLEAMSFGLPCIGVSGEAMGEVIENQITGEIVPPEDVGTLATALTRLLSNGEMREQYGVAARQRVENDFTWDHVVSRISPIIQNFIQMSVDSKWRSRDEN